MFGIAFTEKGVVLILFVADSLLRAVAQKGDSPLIQRGTAVLSTDDSIVVGVHYEWVLREIILLDGNIKTAIDVFQSMRKQHFSTVLRNSIVKD